MMVHVADPRGNRVDTPFARCYSDIFTARKINSEFSELEGCFPLRRYVLNTPHNLHTVLVSRLRSSIGFLQEFQFG